MFHCAPSWWGYLLYYTWLICSSLQQLRRGVDPMSTKRLTEPWADSSLWTFPWEINILTECRCHVLAGEQHWNTTLSCLTWISSSVLFASQQCHTLDVKGHFYNTPSFYYLQREQPLKKKCYLHFWTQCVVQLHSNPITKQNVNSWFCKPADWKSNWKAHQHKT